MRVQLPCGSLDIEVDSYDLPPGFAVVLPVAREIGVREVVDRLCPMKQGNHLTHGEVVEFLVLHILQSPARLPLYRLDQWAADTHAHVLYEHRPEEFNDDRVGKALDAVAEAILDIEAAVVTRALKRFHVDARTIHWDLTNVTFSDAKHDSPLVRRGYGNGALHQRQMQLSLNVTSDGGVPLHHRSLPGNAHQAPLLPEILELLQQRLQRSDLIFVSDRAGISYDNICVWRDHKAHFIGPLAFRDPVLIAALAAVPEEQFTPLEYRSLNAPEDVEYAYPTTIQLQPPQRKVPLEVQALFLRSPRRQRSCAQTRHQKLDKVFERIAKIAGMLNVRCYAKRSHAEKQLAKAVPEELADIVGYELAGQDRALTLRWWLNLEPLRDLEAGDGRYILVYDLPPDADQTPNAIFTLHRRQNIIERRNRNLGSELCVDPVWLQREDRIQALMLVFVLALTVYTLLELCTERAGLDTEHYHKMTAKALLWECRSARIKVVRIPGLAPQRELVMPVEQLLILQRLGFPDPNQLLRATP
jgi:transposase